MSELSAVQRQLVDRLLHRKVSVPPDSKITRVPVGTCIPLSPAQARIWFFSRLYPDSAEYNVFDTLSIKTAPDEARFRAAVRTLMERHDALRLRFLELDGEPVQQDCGVLEPPVTWLDLTGLPLPEAERRAHEIGSADARALLRPDEPPLFRISACALPDGRALLALVAHHLIVDFWSMTLLFGELSALLAGRDPGPANTVGFVDHVSARRAATAEPSLAREMNYWTTKLGGELPILDLPKDRPRPTVPSRLGHAVQLTVPPEVTARLKRLAENEGTTLFVTLLAAYKALLLQLTGQTDFIVGTALAGRDQVVTERLVGCFVKAVALRTDLAGALSYREAVRRVHATVMEAQDHQSVPYDQVVAKLGIPRDLSVNPVFQTYFGAQSAEGLQLAGAEAGQVMLDADSAKWDLTVSLTEGPHELAGYMEGASDLFDDATVARFAGMYVRLLRSLTADPNRPILTHPLISAEERTRILYGLNPYERPCYPYRTLAEPFEEQVERTPQAVALIGEDETLTYAELNARANRFASFLRDAGAGRGTVVALFAERGTAMITALYAVAKTGAAYVPLDPELPDGRIAFMLNDTTPALVLADRASRDRIPGGSWRIITIDEHTDRWAARSPANAPCAGPAGHLSHLLYTSGSTGRPKAVAYPADGAIADIFWMQRSYPYRPEDTTVFKTSHGFDVSLWEIFWPLYFGARLVVCRPGGHRDPRHLVELIERHRVTTIYLIPTMLQVFLDQSSAGSCRSLRWVLSGGEPITPRLRDAFYARLDARLVNGYGPTETGCATDMVVPPDEGASVVPLGRPAANFRLYVLDEDLEPTPIGVPGEVYLGAEVGMAHGYFRRPELTAERFLPDPFGPPGARMYRTGDICRYRDDGILEHLGRIGRQVKIRGMRIELAEVETVLCEHEDVEECVALVVEHAGQQHLLAFVVPHDGAPVVPREPAGHAARLLPAFMVPSIQVVPEIPVNVNGKTDHAALLGQWHGGTARPESRRMIPPSGELETGLAEIFAQVLGVPRVGVTDSFFELGGHSLLIFKLIAACTRELHVRPHVADVFAAPTIRDLAARLGSSLADPQSSLVPLLRNAGQPVVVFIHAASGSALPFYEVARLLGDDFSTYAMQAPEGDTDRAADSIENLAARYVKAVDQVRGCLPVALAGWSMGGCVAVEMARIWRHRGIDVGPVVMLDSWPPPKALVAPAAQAQARTAILGMDVLALEGVDLSALAEAGDEVERLHRVIDRNRHAYLDYEPTWFDGPVYLLRAAEDSSGPRTRIPGDHSAADHGWGEFIGHVVTQDIPGNHFSLLARENAPILASTLRDIIHETESQHSSRRSSCQGAGPRSTSR
jgi:amino acid adenylation domain-containing protein